MHNIYNKCACTHIYKGAYITYTQNSHPLIKQDVGEPGQSHFLPHFLTEQDKGQPTPKRQVHIDALVCRPIGPLMQAVTQM